MCDFVNVTQPPKIDVMHWPIIIIFNVCVCVCLFSTSCSTSTCTTSCSTPYVIFETNSLPYVQRTTLSDRDVSITRATCIDDSGGGGVGGSSDNLPVDNNNIGDDDTHSAATEHILKRASALQHREMSYENIDQAIENENDDDEDDTSQGKLFWFDIIWKSATKN